MLSNQTCQAVIVAFGARGLSFVGGDLAGGNFSVGVMTGGAGAIGRNETIGGVRNTLGGSWGCSCFTTAS